MHQVSAIIVVDTVEHVRSRSAFACSSNDDLRIDEDNDRVSVSVAGTHDQLGDYFTPENTRPLSIVNTDNRILAIAAQLQIEEVAKHWVTNDQQGFIKCRSMNSNIF